MKRCKICRGFRVTDAIDIANHDYISDRNTLDNLIVFDIIRNKNSLIINNIPNSVLFAQALNNNTSSSSTSNLSKSSSSSSSSTSSKASSTTSSSTLSTYTLCVCSSSSR